MNIIQEKAKKGNAAGKNISGNLNIGRECKKTLKILEIQYIMRYGMFIIRYFG